MSQKVTEIQVSSLHGNNFSRKGT